jgi:hypothetical protein
MMNRVHQLYIENVFEQKDNKIIFMLMIFCLYCNKIYWLKRRSCFNDLIDNYTIKCFFKRIESIFFNRLKLLWDLRNTEKLHFMHQINTML